MKCEIKLFSMIAAAMATALSAFGAGVTGDDAKGAVAGWVRLREEMRGRRIGRGRRAACHVGRTRGIWT